MSSNHSPKFRGPAFQHEQDGCRSDLSSQSQEYEQYQLQSPLSASLLTLIDTPESGKTGVSREMADDILSKMKLENSQDDDYSTSPFEAKTRMYTSGRDLTGTAELVKAKESQKSSHHEMDVITKGIFSKMKLEVRTEQIEERSADNETNNLNSENYDDQQQCHLQPISSALPHLTSKPECAESECRYRETSPSPSDISTVVVGETFESGKTGSIEVDNMDVDMANQVLSTMQQKGVYEQFEEECFAYCDSKAEEMNLTTRIEHLVHDLAVNTDWIRPDMSLMSDDDVDEYILEYFDSTFDHGLDVLVDQAVNPKMLSLMSMSDEELEIYFGIRKPEEIEPENIASSDITEVIESNANPDPDNGLIDDQEGDDEVGGFEIDFEEEEEESPAFEKIGETPPPSPQKSVENVSESKERVYEKFPVNGSSEEENVSQNAFENLKGEISELISKPIDELPIKSSECPIVKPLETQIPEDVDGSPVYYLELPDLFAEKLKFFKELREQHLNDSSDDDEIENRKTQ